MFFMFRSFGGQPVIPATTIRYGFPMFLFGNTQTIAQSIWTVQATSPGVWTVTT